MGLLDGLLDATIYFSFDRSGFERHRRAHRDPDIRIDLGDRVCLVTGASAGLGLESARELARRGAQVWLLCRSAERGEAAREQIEADTGSRAVSVAELDISDLASVRRFAASFAAPSVSALIHNAGLIPERRQCTAQGLELAFATHVAGPFLLTRLLEPKLRAASPGRVIFVSSGGMYPARLSLADPDWSQRAYGGVAAYSQTKRMQVVLARMFAERWLPAQVVVHAMHPGWAATDGVRNSLPGFYRFTQGRLRSPAQAADTITWLAAAEEPLHSSGDFWFDRARVSPYYVPFTRETPEERAALWELCARVTA
jgi:dehydrogenase/reductase SDR family member 12